jgi:DNA-binding NtrC family response regulator
MTKKRILIIEDNVVIAFVIRESLAEISHLAEISVTTTAEDAQNKFGSGSWDLIITDYRLPGMSGIELIRNFGPTMKHIPWILITGYGSPELEEEARALGVFHYLIKPFPLDEIRRIALDALKMHPAELCITY